MKGEPLMYYTQLDNKILSFTFCSKEPGSAVTHLIGIIYSVLLTPVLLIKAALGGADISVLIGCSVFMLSMIMLYTASTVYHSFNLSPSANSVLKKIDHMMIFVLIAGSYTPICLTVLRGGIGIPLLLAVWILALLGMLFKLCWVNCPKWLSSVIYIVLGWSCVAAFPALYSGLAPAGFFWLLGGGILYTVGGVIYAMKFRKLNELSRNFGSHEIFHVFVMLGNLCQFFCIFKYCL